MPCSCQKNKFEVVMTVTDPKTQQSKEKVVGKAQYKSIADGIARRYPGSVVREVDPAKK
jgi:hypothetical protein